jgi:hypothetical protein
MYREGAFEQEDALEKLLTSRNWGDEWQTCLEVARIIGRLETEMRDAQILTDLSDN